MNTNQTPSIESSYNSTMQHTHPACHPILSLSIPTLLSTYLPTFLHHPITKPDHDEELVPEESDGESNDNSVYNLALMIKLFAMQGVSSSSSPSSSASSSSFPPPPSLSLLHPTSLLLYSSMSGCGKNTLIQSLCKLFQLNIYIISFSKLLIKRNVKSQVDAFKEAIHDLYNKIEKDSNLYNKNGNVLILNEVEMICCGNDQESIELLKEIQSFIQQQQQQQQQEGTANTFSSSTISTSTISSSTSIPPPAAASFTLEQPPLSSSTPRILIIGISSLFHKLSNKDKLILTNLFQFKFSFHHTPSYHQRMQILRAHLNDLKIAPISFPTSSSSPSSSSILPSYDVSSLNFSWIANNTQGWTPADLVGLIKFALARANRRMYGELQQEKEKQNDGGVDKNGKKLLLRIINEDFLDGLKLLKSQQEKLLMGNSSKLINKYKQVNLKLPQEKEEEKKEETSDDSSTIIVSNDTSSNDSNNTINNNKSNILFNDVCGLEDVKQRLREILLLPLLLYSSSSSLSSHHSPHHHPLGLSLSQSRGILLYGVPGVGKTHIARTVAKEMGIGVEESDGSSGSGIGRIKWNFLVLESSELICSGIGESEKYLNNIFNKCKKISPCILFIDEIQAIFSRKYKEGDNNGSSSNFNNKLMSQLLFEIDSLPTISSSFSSSSSSSSPPPLVLVLCATNLPSSLDPSLLRPGRIDQILYVGVPNEIEREVILKKEMIKIQEGEDGVCSRKYEKGLLEEKIKIIAHEKTINFSVIDLIHLVGRAGLETVKRLIKKNNYKDSYNNNNNNQIDDDDCVKYEDFLKALEYVQPSVTPNMIKECQVWGEKFKKKKSERK